MWTYVLKRLLTTIPVIVVVAFIVFSILYATPGDPALILAGDNATPQQVEEVRQRLGLDKDFISRFYEWSGSVLAGDLGTSLYTRLPVVTLIGQRLLPTVSLVVLTFLIAIFVAVPLGVVAATRHGSWVDRLGMIVSVLGFSVPVFVVGYVLAYTFALKLGWLPVQGFASPQNGIWPFISSLILPSTALASLYVALISRITRSAMLEVLGQDYIRTARAKGLGEMIVVFLHALKNAAVPISTVIGLGFASLLGGAVVIETVFSIPGLGLLMVTSILSRDYPVIQGVLLLSSITYVILNLLIDLLYGLFDPRIRY